MDLLKVTLISKYSLGITVFWIIHGIQPRLGPENPVPLERVGGMVTGLERTQISHGP